MLRPTGVFETEYFSGHSSQNSKRYSLSQRKSNLPIHSHKLEILYALEKYSTVILISETGSGKSTQIPQYLHESGWTSSTYSVVCTQPRRIAVLTIAKRVAEEVGCNLGDDVGYSIRFDQKYSTHTKIKYCTDGVLIREVMLDPLLSKYSVIMIDEAHERSLNTDILFGLLKKIRKKRPELRIIISSATVDAVIIKNFFESSSSTSSSSAIQQSLSFHNTSGTGGADWGQIQEDNKEDTYILQLTSKSYPVDILYLQAPTRSYIQACIDTILKIHQNELPGDILVFLPGSEEIDKTIYQLKDVYTGYDLLILPLYGALPHYQQMQVFQSTPSDSRKVIVATNIAETSLTIDGIKYVIDTGYMNLNYYNVHTGIDMLITCPVSQASARQRAGRCGRTQAGKCYRLYTEQAYHQLALHTTPEMQRTDISHTILQLKSLGVQDVVHFDFLAPPSVDSMIFSLELLYSLGALDDTCTLTSIGEMMAEMPIEPKMAKILLSSYDYGCSEDILSIVAMCQVDYPFIVPRHRMQHSSTSNELKKRINDSMREFLSLDGDHITLLQIYRKYSDVRYDDSWCDSMCLQPKIMKQSSQLRAQLKTLLKNFSPPGVVLASSGDDYIPIKKCLISGYFKNIAKLGHDGHYYTLKGNHAVTIHSSSIYASYGIPPSWVLYNEVIQSTTPQIREVCQIEPLWIVEIASHYYELKNLQL